MNLKRIKDNAEQGTFEVGNLNDYINIINKTNVWERSNVSVEDLQDLDSEYAGRTLSYRILNYEDASAVKSIDINGTLFLNIYE